MTTAIAPQTTGHGFQIHNAETADPQTISNIQSHYGMVPNLLGGLAEAPAAAEGYMALSTLMGQTSFTPTERHVLWFTINAFHECHYCMAAHTFMANKEGVDEAVIQTAREVGSYSDPKLEALRVFALAMTEKRGWVEASDIDAFLEAGFTRQQIFEVVLAISHKVLSNYTNHLLETPVDPPFAAFTWQSPNA
ncbi:MAG: carboxymuconolactone decarboxylase family protein [Acidobacteriota bacterium]